MPHFKFGMIRERKGAYVVVQISEREFLICDVRFERTRPEISGSRFTIRVMLSHVALSGKLSNILQGQEK